MRARNIKPGFFVNEEVGSLSMTGRILFIGLWCMADLNGFLEYRPQKLKASIFPYDSLNLIKFLEEVSSKGLITIWCDKDKNCHFIEIPNFKEHQSPHPGEKKSNIKEIVRQNINLIKLHEIKFNFRLMLGKRKEERGNSNDEIDIPNMVISYLNEKALKRFKITDANLEGIKVRIKEGYHLDDFKQAIDNQVNEWLHDTKMNKYLRPSTLFQKSKFDGYVNNTKSKSNDNVDSQTRKELELLNGQK